MQCCLGISYLLKSRHHAEIWKAACPKVYQSTEASWWSSPMYLGSFSQFWDPWLSTSLLPTTLDIEHEWKIQWKFIYRQLKASLVNDPTGTEYGILTHNPPLTHAQTTFILFISGRLAARCQWRLDTLFTKNHGKGRTKHKINNCRCVFRLGH